MRSRERIDDSLLRRQQFKWVETHTLFSVSLSSPLHPPGSKKMEHKGNSWHENCFSCNRCQQPIGTRCFVQKDVNNYCLPCYEKQFAQQCVHCKKVMHIHSCQHSPEALNAFAALFLFLEIRSQISDCLWMQLILYSRNALKVAERSLMSILHIITRSIFCLKGIKVNGPSFLWTTFFPWDVPRAALKGLYC